MAWRRLSGGQLQQGGLQCALLLCDMPQSTTPHSQGQGWGASGGAVPQHRERTEKSKARQEQAREQAAKKKARTKARLTKQVAQLNRTCPTFKFRLLGDDSDQEGSTCQSAPQRGQSVATRLGQQDVEDEDCLYGTSASSVDGQQEHEHACTEDLYPDQEYEEISRVRAGPWAPRGVAPPGGCRSGHAVLMEAVDTVYARYVHAVKQLFDTSHGPPPLHFSSACALQAAAFPMPAWSDEHKTITWGEARRGL